MLIVIVNNLIMYVMYMDVSENSGTPKSSHFNRVFHYKPSILGYPYFWKHPYNVRPNGRHFLLHHRLRGQWQVSFDAAGVPQLPVETLLAFTKQMLGFNVQWDEFSKSIEVSPKKTHHKKTKQVEVLQYVFLG